jgi:hypothetical protein
MPEGPFRYRSAHAPVPLSELAFWNLPTPPAAARRSGRTFPTTRSGGCTALFLTNDEGFYVLDANAAANKLREIETPDERGKLLETYRAQRRALRHGRLDIPHRVPPMSGHDLWDSNQPGSTLFLPVCDVSTSLISLIAQFVDPALRRYAPARGGANIVDDRHGGLPAGTERWLQSRFLDAARILPLTIVERQACYYVFSEPAAIRQNIFLATEALGLGVGSTADFSRSKFSSAWVFAFWQRTMRRPPAIPSGRRHAAAARRGQFRIACPRPSIGPERFASVRKGSPAPRRSATTFTIRTGAFPAAPMRCI